MSFFIVSMCCHLRGCRLFVSMWVSLVSRGFVVFVTICLQTSTQTPHNNGHIESCGGVGVGVGFILRFFCRWGCLGGGWGLCRCVAYVDVYVVVLLFANI